MKTLSLFFSAVGMLGLFAKTAPAQTLYGATSSGHGELYVLDPASGGILQDIGALNDAGSVNYSVTGLAFDPLSGVLYGSTGGNSGHSLLTITPQTVWSAWLVPITPAAPR